MEHIVKSFDRDLETVLSELTTMAKLVRTQLIDVTGALESLDLETASRVMKRDAEVNGYEVLVDALIESVFARRQPAACDLRMLIGMGRMSVDYERMGDEIRNIAASIEKLHALDLVLLANRAMLLKMVPTIVDMMNDTLVSLTRRDTSIARQVIEDDKTVDEVYKSTCHALMLHMMQDPKTIEDAQALMWMGRALQRVGDHVKNLAEAVIYIIEGADVRHEFYTPMTEGDTFVEPQLTK